MIGTFVATSVNCCNGTIIHIGLVAVSCAASTSVINSALDGKKMLCSSKQHDAPSDAQLAFANGLLLVWTMLIQML